VPEPSSLISFLLVALVVIVVPGPSVVFVIGRAMILGTRGALLSVWGNAVGVGVQIVAVALGVGSLVYASEVLFSVVKVLGSLFLIYLGIQGIVHRKQFVSALETGALTSTKRVLLDSVVVGLTNAKTLVFFIATFPLFVDPTRGSVVTQMFVLGGFFFVIGVASDMVWALAAGSARNWLSKSPDRLASVRMAGGIALVLLGTYLGYYSFFLA
jgi:threonine/homoserine/homoserine lactone efflux protein